MLPETTIGLLLSLRLLTGPASQPAGHATVCEISPPDGGVVVAWAANRTIAIGHSRDIYAGRLFVWTAATGPVYLDQILPSPLPRDTIALDAWESGDALMIHADAWTADGSFVRHSLLIRLPLDVNLWFSPADFDHDGDVDQADFGLLQRRIGQPDCPMTVQQFLRQMGGPR